MLQHTLCTSHLQDLALLQHSVQYFGGSEDSHTLCAILGAPERAVADRQPERSLEESRAAGSAVGGRGPGGIPRDPARRVRPAPGGGRKQVVDPMDPVRSSSSCAAVCLHPYFKITSTTVAVPSQPCRTLVVG